MTKVIDKIVSDLEKVGIEYAFGYPGGRTIEFIEALSESNIVFVRARDEREASFMAEAYGRVHRKPAILTGQGPWIGSTGAQGAMEARFGSTPMLIITEASERGDYSPLAPYQQSSGDYGGISLPKILDSFTKEWWFAQTPLDAIRCTQLAIKHATGGRPGPTAVILGGNTINSGLPEQMIPKIWDPKKQVKNWKSRPTQADINEAVNALKNADRPTIIAGNGVHAADAHSELLSVAELYDCTVTTSFLGKSSIPETHKLSGGVIGAFGHEGANQLVSNSDVILIVGCRMNPNDTNWGSASFIRPSDQTLIHADIDTRNAGWVYPADIGLIGDAKETLHELYKNGSKRSTGAIQRAKEAKKSFTPPKWKKDEISPARVIKELEKAVSEETYICTDAGNNRMWMFNFYMTKSKHSYFGPGGTGVMGWSCPAAVSLALTTGREVVSVAGDGGFSMTMNAVETAVDHDISPTFIILNDRALGTIRDFESHTGSIDGSQFGEIKFADTARSF